MGRKPKAVAGEAWDLNERLQAELAEANRVVAALRGNEGRYFALFDNMLGGYAHCEMLFERGVPHDFVYIEVNDTFERITGLKSVTGKKVSDVIPGIRESNPELFSVYGRVAQTGRPERFETHVEALGQWFSVSAYSPAEGHFIAVFDDITARKQAEAQLRESEERYRTVVESVTDAIVTIDQDSRIIRFANDSVERILGYAASELVGQELTKLMPARFHDAHRGGVRRYVESGVKKLDWRGTKVPGLHKNGKEVPLEVSYGEYMRDGQRHIVGVMRDVTELRRTEDTLRLFRALIDRSSDLIEVVDPDSGQLLDVNEKWYSELAYSREELKDLRVVDVDPKLDEQTFRQAVETLRKAGTLLWDGLHKRKDGSTFPVEVSISLVQLEREYAVAVVRNITERKRAEGEFRNLQQQFLQAQKMEAVGRLAGGVAHDFNNLLTIINGTAELASMALRADDPLRSDLEGILQAGRRATTLTRQLLAFSRKQILEPVVLDINALITDMLGMLQRLMGEDVNLDFVPSPDLGSVKADPGQIEQVLMNLAVNGRDAMPTGGLLTIATRNVDLDEEHAKHHATVTPGPHVMVSVTDAGVGMDEATQARIFEPFFTTKSEGQGTGLGLATVYGIVKQTGGSIWVYSELGKGTAIKIYLPRVTEVARDSRPVRQVAVVTGTETLLVVEDDHALRDLSRRVLRSAGYTVLTASNGGEALLLLERHDGPVALMLTDVVMPGMSGRELAARLAPMRPQMKILYTSGYTDDAIIRHGVLEHAAHFIHKPFATAELARKVREVLDAKDGSQTTGPD